MQLGNWCHLCHTCSVYIWVESRNCGCLVAWFCYQRMARPGSKTAAVPWPDPYVFIVYMTHRLSVYILYGHTDDALILVTSYLHIHFSYVHECILTAFYCAVFVYSCMCFYDCLHYYYCTLSEMVISELSARLSCNEIFYLLQMHFVECQI